MRLIRPGLVQYELNNILATDHVLNTHIFFRGLHKLIHRISEFCLLIARAPSEKHRYANRNSQLK